MELGIEVLAGFLILLIVLVYLFSAYSKSNHSDPDESGKMVNKNKPTRAELMNTLNWMFQYGVIDNQQYNEILLKSLPYFK